MCLIPHKITAFDSGTAVFQIGGFTSNQGKSQHVDIEGLIGDDFSVSKSSDQNLLIGLGYFFKTCNIAKTNLLYGINAFYLAPVQVNGKVTQENLFTNLSYRYSITNYPILFATKASINCFRCHDLVVDVGVGPNIMYVHRFKERSLDNGVTIPDHIFSSKTAVTFSASAGLGWRINHLWKNISFEIDYRFFYLGESKLKKNNNQIKNHLHTGSCYANALFFSISM
jgi:hypothetical protein